MQPGCINFEALELIVKTVFRKAISDKGYCTLYGELCERLIKRELILMGQQPIIANVKNSILRTMLLKASREKFTEFFDKEIRAK